MTILRSTALVAAPPSAVLAAATETGSLRSALEPLGFTLSADPAQLTVGEEVGLTWPVFGISRLRTRLRLLGLEDRAVRLGGSLVRFSLITVVTGAGTLITAAVEWALPGGRRTVLRTLAALLAGLRVRAEELVSAPVVVGAVVVRGGTVLAAQRARPATLAGRWEFPGGQVEDGEEERVALERECREELGADIVVADRIGPDLPLPGGRVLRLYTAEVAGEPSALEHRALRWVPGAELAALDWLDADRVVLSQVRDLLTARSASG